MKMAKKLDSGIALVFVVLIMGLLDGSLSAAANDEAVIVNEEDRSNINFPSDYYPSDTTPPTIAITCSPENPTADQQITFSATASDRSGINRIEILVNARKVEECFDSGSCIYIGGPYPDYAGTSVSYGANAYDKADNRAWTGYKSVHISEPRDIIPPTVIDNTPVGTDVPVTTEITITFSESMNKESAEDAFSIYPEVTGRFDWNENMMIFKPHSDLDHETEYIVNLKGSDLNQFTGQLTHLEGGNWGAMDLAENIMVRSYNWEFKTNSPERIPPTAIISAPSTEINVGEGMIFSAEASSDRDGKIISYDWDFGDSNTGAGISVEHTYPHSGHYTVTLTVTDNDKLSDTDTVDISVTTPALSVSISTNPMPSGESDEIIVQVFSDGNPVAGANVYLSSTLGSLYPTEGGTDESGEFVSTYTAPLVSTTQRYTISAMAEKEGYEEGINTVSDSIFIETIPALSVSISTNPMPSGESDEIIVQVFSDGNPVAGANVYLSSTLGSLYPTEGGTDESGEFVSTYTAPLVSTTQRYTISATVEKEGYIEGKDSVPNSIFVEQPPITTPAPVVTPIPTPEETPTPAPTPPPSQPIVPIAIAAIAAVTVLIYMFKVKKPPEPQPGKEKKKSEPDEEEKRQYGSVSASSDPDGAVVLLDGAYHGISAMRMDNIPIGPHVVVFAKFGYFKCEKKAIVNANQTTHVHCDLTEIPEIKLKLSAEPTEIPADGKSKSMITIRIEDKNEIPIPVPEDIMVELVTNIGKIESPVRIPAGRASVTATLTSFAVQGTATVEATAEFLKGSTTVEFSQST